MTRRNLPPAHRATTVELRAIYPFVVSRPLGTRSCYLGREPSGRLFCFDPWECYEQGVVTSPNMVVFGQIGRGKSAFVKSFLWRQRIYGRRCWALDPKGEYAPLAEACGSRPLSLGPGLGLRLNPLDVGTLPLTGPPGQRGGGGEAPAIPADGLLVHRRRAELLGALLTSSLGRPLLPAERAAADVALAGAEAGQRLPSLPAVAAALFDPATEAARSLGTDVEGLRHDGRQVALELRRLVEGDLAGMFDGPTSPGLDLDGAMVVVDLSHVYSSPALGLLMVCAISWLQSRLVPPGAAGTPPEPRVLVMDEAWAVLGHLGTARWVQSSFKLARAFGVANVAVLHRFSDLKALGGEGSEQQRLAEGLLADTETRVLFGQAPGEAEKAASVLGLSGPEQLLLGQLPRGAALWKVGGRSFLVDHDLSPREMEIVDTDSAMRQSPRRCGGAPTENTGTGG